MTGELQTQAARPFRRRVFYIPGYDPFPPRRYRELYRSESAAQAAISGYEVALLPQRGGAGYGWRAETEIGGARAEAEIEVLVWSDLVRGSMGRGIFATYLQLVRTASVYLRSGALWRLMGLRKGPMIAALYPVGMLTAQLALAVLAGSAAFRLAAPLSGAFAALAGLLAAVALLQVFRRLDGRIYAYYLMHDYAYSAQHGGAYPPALEQRLQDFRRRIGAAMGEGYDEVLVVGHSSGAHLAVSVLADLIRQGGAKGPALALLSLGQVAPMLSFLPGAGRLRGDLAYLCTRAEVAWVDVSAPGDGCAFALCDPVSVSGVAPAAGKRWPLVLSAAFRQTLSPERWRALRWRFFRLHFQYLCAFDRPGDYDYFQITAGPMTLAQRFAGRAPSASRIERPANRHRGLA